MGSRSTDWTIVDTVKQGTGELYFCHFLLQDEDIFPAYHSESSAVWKVLNGEGFILFEQSPDNWLICSALPTSEFVAELGLNFAIIPVTPMELEVLCLEAQLDGNDLEYGASFPEKATMYLTGKILQIQGNTITIEGNGERAEVLVEDEELVGLRIGAVESLPKLINISAFFSDLDKVPPSVALMKALGCIDVAGRQTTGLQAISATDPPPQPDPPSPPSKFRRVGGSSETSLSDLHPRASRYADSRKHGKYPRS